MITYPSKIEAIKAGAIKLAVIFYCLIALPSISIAQTFNSGSTGTYGPMTITANTTLQLPADGIFHCTTINVASGATLKFAPNALNTPVYLLATGEVIIAGTIDVSGKQALGRGAGGAGGPGGFAGGNGGPPGAKGSAGLGPGGGRQGTHVEGYRGAYRFAIETTAATATYGNSLLMPLVGGSGGSGSGSPEVPAGQGAGGGGGGGAVLIASNTRIVFPAPTGSIFGKVIADGGDVFTLSYLYAWSSGAGSGGAIRMIGPVITGSGDFSVRCQGRTNGRFRIDAFDSTNFSIHSGDTPEAVGAVMIVFPSPLPKLSVVATAGTNIAENTPSAIIVNLPTGSPATQPIKIRARDFGGIVPVRIRLVPENGEATTFDGTIDNTVSNPAETTVNVTMPLGVAVSVQVYTR